MCIYRKDDIYNIERENRKSEILSLDLFTLQLILPEEIC